MRRIDYSSADPAVNLALEEVLLDEVEHGRHPDTIRFWESPAPFVVLGTGQQLATEVHEDHCAADKIPIMRRCTAGGCVLQGPGSLNFAIFLTLAKCPEVANLHQSYRHLLGVICSAMGGLGVKAAQAGISDIAIGDRKVSGNAQRRRRNAILHHGTLLYQADTEAIARYLREPADRPEYRGGRDHSEFVTVLPVDPCALKEAISVAFGCDSSLDALSPKLLARAETLAMEKYRQREWIYRR